MQQPATRYQPWVAEVLQEYTAFGKFVAGTKLAADVQVKVRVQGWHSMFVFLLLKLAHM